MWGGGKQLGSSPGAGLPRSGPALQRGAPPHGTSRKASTSGDLWDLRWQNLNGGQGKAGPFEEIHKEKAQDS